MISICTLSKTFTKVMDANNSFLLLVWLFLFCFSPILLFLHLCISWQSRRECRGDAILFWLGVVQFTPMKPLCTTSSKKKNSVSFALLAQLFWYKQVQKNQKRGENKTNTRKLSYLHLTTLNLLKLFVGNGRQHFSLRDIMT